jgi:hypothetical protein
MQLRQSDEEVNVNRVIWSVVSALTLNKALHASLGRQY